MKIFGKSIFIILTACCKITFAQNAYVEGIVISSTTSKPIEYANIQDKRNLKGITSDSLGNFKLAVATKNTLLTISCVGYENAEIKVNPNSFVVVKLKPVPRQLEEFTVKPKENPAWEIIRRTLANANRNNPQNYLNLRPIIILKSD